MSMSRSEHSVSRDEQSTRMAGLWVSWEEEAGAVWDCSKVAEKSHLEIETVFGKH